MVKEKNQKNKEDTMLTRAVSDINQKQIPPSHYDLKVTSVKSAEKTKANPQIAKEIKEVNNSLVNIFKTYKIPIEGLEQKLNDPNLIVQANKKLDEYFAKIDKEATSGKLSKDMVKKYMNDCKYLNEVIEAHKLKLENVGSNQKQLC